MKLSRRELLVGAGLVGGAAISATLVRAVLSGASSSDPVANPQLNAEQQQMLAQVAEQIIPETDTPGAIAAGVPQFVQSIVSDWYNDDERRAFFAQCQAFNNNCQHVFKTSFINLDSAQQVAALSAAELAGQGEDQSTLSTQLYAFFKTIKELTVLGYYTSEIGATQELIYNPVPMKYDGAYLFEKVGKQWTY